MNASTTISITEARKRIFDIAEKVQKPSVHFTLTEGGRPKAVILSAEEFESIMDTLEILSSPKMLKEIKEAENDYKRGKVVSWEDAKEILGKKSDTPSAKVRLSGAKNKNYGGKRRKV